MSTKTTGDLGEDLAIQYLESQGWTIFDRNYRYEREELDAVAYAPAEQEELGGEIVFVEVKTRRGTGFGRPEEAVDEAKQRAIVRVAEAWLHERKLEGALCRFDVVAVTLPDDDSSADPEIELFKNAFWVS